MTVEKDQLLFEYGDQLAPIYVIQSGEIELFVKNESNVEVLLRSLEQSIVQILPISTLKEVFKADFCSLVRLIQITMIRVQQVVLRTLCNYFGLPLDALTLHIYNEKLEDVKEFLTDRTTTIDSIAMISRPQSYFQKEEVETKEQDTFEVHNACVDAVCKLLKNDVPYNAVNMYYIHKGSVACIFKSDCEKITMKSHAICWSGRFACILPILSGLNSPFEIVANEDCILLSVSNFLFHKISILCPSIIPMLAEVVMSSLTPFLKNITFGFDWDNFESGANVYNQGMKSANIYIILHGRLRLIHENHCGEKNVVGEFTRNDFVGIGETLEEKPRTASLAAVRSSEVVVISASFLKFLQKYGDQNFQVATPIKNFASELNAALNTIGPTAVLDSSCITYSDSNPIISRFRYLQLITQLETDNIMVLWVCDNTFSYWTKQCILHADLILFVALVEENFAPNALEKQIKRMKNLSAPKQLVLLHRENLYKPPDNTAMWLKDRKWISDFHHIRCQPRVYREQIAYQFSDISRLARRLTNNAVGLVLGGGGARGFAHLGVVRALEKAGI
ncbi:hypothetical protein MXB_1103 [Myxobolus squamalis]|nr:hypothetical protein MXB_1103 [Myxobolus squamalis]